MVISRQATTSEVGIEDVEYLRHGDTPLLARVFRPRGDGPFPIMVELHGGAGLPGSADCGLSGVFRRHSLRDPLVQGAG